MAVFGLPSQLVCWSSSSVLTAVVTLLILQQASAQDAPAVSSSNGKDFYIGFMRNFGGSSFTTLRLLIGTDADSADYVVDAGGRTIQMGTVTSGTPVEVDIPTDPTDLDLQVIDSNFANRERGIHVYTTGDNAIYVIGENSVSPFNYGLFLAYPCLTIEAATTYEYYVISTDDVTDFLRSQFLLVGCEDDTTITITPTQSVSIPQDLQMASTSVTVDSATASHELTLNQMQTLYVSSFDDLTGTKIVSNKPLTVISGHECANVPLSESGCEPLAIHVPPTATWGTKFLLAPFAGRNGVQTFKAISAETTSVIYTCGTSSRGAPNVTSLLFNTAEYCYLESSKPLLLIQLSIGGSIDGSGDPAVSMISPIDQYVSESTFYSIQTNDFPSNYISVTVTTEHYNPASILLDGEPIDCEWKKIQNSDDETVGYGCNKTVSSGSAEPKQHTVSHMDEGGLISVLVYGFSAVPASGYAYLAGQKITVSEDDGEEVIIDVEFLPFADLTGFPGVKELDKTGPDSTSDPIFIPDGLIFGDQIVTSAYINENGVISFDKPWKYSLPDRFPTNFFWTRQGLAVAPFWSDNDIRKEGAVRYASYFDSAAERAANPQGAQLLKDVNNYLKRFQAEGESEFRGRWLLAVHWDHVHPSPHGEEDHNGIPEDELNKFNNYQTVVVSDVLRTYVVFSYMCGEIQWSALGRNRAAVVGFNAEGNMFGNHPLSGFSAIGEAVSCTFNLGKRRKRQDDVTAPANMELEIPTDPILRAKVEKCLNAIKFDREILLVRTNAETLSDMLEPCPCSIRQVDQDFGRYIKQDGSPQCYVSAKPLLVRLLLVQITLTQQCCYDPDNGNLQTSRKDGFSGTMLLHHPHTDTINYKNRDKALREDCCEIGFDAYCDKFFEQRIINKCEKYSSPAVGSGSGDPHYRTFDGRYYDFQGDGDFTLLEVLPQDSDVSVFTLQGRLGKTHPASRVTWHMGLAFGQPNLSFDFGRPNGFRVFQTRPAPATEITGQLVNGQPWVDATGNAMLTRNGITINVAFYQSGVTLSANGYGSTLMNFQVKVPRSFSKRTRGILGNLDDDSSNDFYAKGESTPLPNGISHLALYNQLLSWKLSRPDSLFSNPTRRKRQDPPTTDFVPLVLDDLTFTDEQRIICEGNTQCLFDLAVTGSQELAMTTLDHEKDTNTTEEALNNFPPNISSDATFRVTIGLESVLTLNVVDPGDNFTLSVRGGLPDNSVLEKVSDDEYVFRWTLQEITNKTLVFIANDTRGASSTFIPTVEICACANGGNCTLDGLLSNAATVVMNCLCSEAFDGRFCEEDRNGCSEIQCFDGVECMDVPAPGVGAVCGSCPLGYTGDAQKCYDIDECSLNDTLCQQVCINTDGSFMCACMDGYRLIEGTNQCEDINECEGVNDCQQLCENTVGSYLCSCSEGFSLGMDGRNCTADVPCGGECSFGCAVIGGEEQCFCPIGFELSTPGGTQCADQDECLTEPCEHMCANTEGSFDCSCRTGYGLQNDGTTCEDIDECLMAALESVDPCVNNSNSQCVNTEGSFDCVCVPGYIVVNGTCERITEPPPPPPPVVRPASSEENSLNFTSPTLTPETFTPARQQKFREVAAAAVVNFCSVVECNLVISEEEKQRVSGLKVDATNVAIPTSLIVQDEEGRLQFTIYVQLNNGFLSKEHLDLSLMQAEEQFRDAGFLTPLPTDPPTTEAPTTEAPTTEAPTTEAPTTQAPTTEPKPVDCTLPADSGDCRAAIPRYFFNSKTGVCEVFTYGGCGGNENNFEKLEECIQECNPNGCPPYCTVKYCSSPFTRTSLCTLPESQDSACDESCRVTYCHTCYYADEYRELPGDCSICSSYAQLTQPSSKCLRKWAVCVRRANGKFYPKARGRKERTQDRFRCYEHPCLQYI